MSRELTSSISPRLVLWHLSQIDEECDKDLNGTEIQVGRGPFGVFKIAKPPGPPLASCGPTAWTDSQIQLPHEAQLNTSENEDLPPPTEPGTVLHHSPALEPIRLAQDESDQNPFGLDMEWWIPGDWWDTPSLTSTDELLEMTIGSSCGQEIRDNLVASSAQHQQEGQLTHPNSELPAPNIFGPDTQIAIPTPPQTATSLSSITPATIDYGAVQHDAVLLLKHYSTTILRGLTPFRHSKTPWHILFIPHAKSCLAALTLGESMDHASFCAFYGTLSVSAFSFGGLSNAQRWHEQAKAYEQQARYHARLMLRTAYDIPKTAKYKSVLMALLTMVQVSIASGNRDQVEVYFLEAEKFIRVKGLNRRKSRKVRLLHHCYVFERMLHESIYPGSTHSAHRRSIRQAIEACGAIAYSQDSLSFRLIDWNDLDQEMRKIKGQDEGENDLHLQISGIWLATLYPEIFGIPEIHVFLLSLSIRLARARDDEAGSYEGTQGSFGLKEFLHCAKAVERCINQLRHVPSIVASNPSTVDLDEQPDCQWLQNNLAQAMQLALAIYFYRRVYELDSAMLQQNVAGVRDCLLRFEERDACMGYGLARLIWPAFIAASEAEDPDVRASFLAWFQNSGKRSGQRVFADTEADIKRIWRERSSCKSTHIQSVPNGAAGPGEIVY